jgi:hypothetical protein
MYFSPVFVTIIALAAVLKVTEDIRSNIEDGQVTVLVLFDFSQAFDMVIQVLLTVFG